MTTPMPDNRQTLPDLIRAFALVGIATVNVQLFAYPMETGTYGDATASAAGWNAAFLMAWLCAGKFYALFSLMFGASHVYQERAAQKSGANFIRQQTRRTIGLGVLGVLHAIFLFLGDILLTYALLGAVLVTARHMEPRTLIRSGILFIVLQVGVLLGLAGMVSAVEAFKPGMMASKLAETLPATKAAFGDGSFVDAVLYRASSFPEVLPSVLMTQGVSTFGYFLIGVAFVKSGWIADPSAQIWSRARWIALPAGLLVGLPGAWLFVNGQDATSPIVMVGLSLITLAAMAQSLGYAGWLALAAKSPGPIARFFARAGQASLSAYLLQSVILVTLFEGWGFGLYNTLPAQEAILIGVAAGLASVVAMGLWMALFRRGPMEMGLRAFTYS